MERDYDEAGRLPTRWVEDEEKTSRAKQAQKKVKEDPSGTGISSNRTVAKTMKAMRAGPLKVWPQVEESASTIIRYMMKDLSIGQHDGWRKAPDHIKRHFIDYRIVRFAIHNWEDMNDVNAYQGAVGLDNQFKRALQIVMFMTYIFSETGEIIHSQYEALRDAMHREDVEQGKKKCGVCDKTFSFPLCPKCEHAHTEFIQHRDVWSTFKSSMQMMVEWAKVRDQMAPHQFIQLVKSTRKPLLARGVQPPKPAKQRKPEVWSLPSPDPKPLSNKERRTMEFELRKCLVKTFETVSADAAAAEAAANGAVLPHVHIPKGLSAHDLFTAGNRVNQEFGMWDMIDKLRLGDGEQHDKIEEVIEKLRRDGDVLRFVQQGSDGIIDFFKTLIKALQSAVRGNATRVIVIVLGAALIVFGAFYIVTSNVKTWEKILVALSLVPVLAGTIFGCEQVLSDIVRCFETMKQRDRMQAEYDRTHKLPVRSIPDHAWHVIQKQGKRETPDEEDAPRITPFTSQRDQELLYPGLKGFRQQQEVVPDRWDVDSDGEDPPVLEESDDELDHWSPEYTEDFGETVSDPTQSEDEDGGVGFRQQGWEDWNFGSIMEKVGSKFATVLAGEEGKHKPGTSVFSIVHGAASLTRDVTTLTAVILPVAESLIGSVYEAITGNPWIPWAEKKIHEQVIPLLNRGSAYARRWETPGQIRNLSAFRKEVEEFLTEVDMMEKQLVLGRANVRYTVPVANLRKVTDVLIHEIKCSTANKGKRIEPVGFMIFGASGTGKSTSMEYFHRALAPTFHALRPEMYPAEYDARIIFPRNDRKPYWEGVANPAIVTWVDAYSVDGLEDHMATSAEILQVMSSDPWQPDMAFQGKGNTFIEPLLGSCTRNGGPRIRNAGTTDPLSVNRRFHMTVQKLFGGNKADPDSWIFERFDVHGESMGPITTSEIIAELEALLWHHFNEGEALVAVKPVPKRTPEQLREAGAKAAEAVRAQLTRAPAAAKKAPAKKAPRYYRQQGNTNKRQTALEAVRTRYFKVVDVLSRFDVGQDTEEDRDFILEESSVWSKPEDSFGDRLELVLDDARKGVSEFFTSTTDYTARSWDSVMEFVKESKDRFILSMGEAYAKSAMSRAYSSVLEWVSTHKLGVICMALSFLVGIAGVIGAGVAIAKLVADKEDDTSQEEESDNDVYKQQYKVKQLKPTNRSRGWKQHHPNDEVRGGRMVKGGKARKEEERGGDGYHNKAGKILPRRMRDPIYRQQVKSHELPLIAALLRNVYRVSFVRPDGRLAGGQIVMTHGRWSMTCKHIAYHLASAQSITLKQTYVDVNGKATTNIKKVRHPVRYVMLDDKEDAFVKWDTDLDMAHDIRDLFVRDDETDSVLDYPTRDIRILWRDDRGERFISESPTATCDFYEVGYNVDEEVEGAQPDTDTFYWSYPITTPDGSSGGMVVTMDGGRVRKILGIHTGSNSVMGTGLLVTEELVRDSTTDEPSIEHVPTIRMEDAEDQHVPVSSGVPLGKVEFKQQGSGKNKLQPSPLAHHLRNDAVYPIQTLNLPTVMYASAPHSVQEKWARRGVIPEQEGLSEEPIDPWEKGSKSPPFVSVDTTKLDEVWDDRWVPEMAAGRYYIITPEQAVFGAPQLGIEGIDMTSSPGYNLEGLQPFDRWILVGSDRFKKEKKPFYEWHPDLKGAIREIYACLQRGNYYTGLVVDSLKAELRSKKRVLGVETRIYYATHMAGLIVARQFTECLTSAEKKTPTVSTPMVGINPMSPEWKEIWMALRRFHEFMCLDSVNFDQHSQQSITHNIGIAIPRALKARGTRFIWVSVEFWTQEGFDCTDEEAMHGITAAHVATGSSVHIRGSYAYYCPQVMSSGQNRTSALGSYRVRVTTNAAIYAIIRAKDPDIDVPPAVLFWERTLTKTFGDDMICGKDRRLEFTSYEFAQMYVAMFGGELTTADKDPLKPDTPFTRLEDIVILKRRFVYKDGMVLAPLEKKSIEQSLLWCESRARAMETCAQTIQSAMLEAALHGEKYYNLLYGAIQRAATKAGVPFHPPSFGHVMDMVRKA